MSAKDTKLARAPAEEFVAPQLECFVTAGIRR